jgi:hypothetical protein
MARIAHSHDDIPLRSLDDVPQPPKLRLDGTTLVWFAFALLVAIAMIFGFWRSEAPSLQ